MKLTELFFPWLRTINVKDDLDRVQSNNWELAQDDEQYNKTMSKIRDKYHLTITITDILEGKCTVTHNNENLTNEDIVRILRDKGLNVIDNNK